jgi:uncharacterized protein YjbJ (UPF0337 family)
MSNVNEKPFAENDEDHGIKDHIGGMGQRIIGEIERIGGILTADPNTTAEGEYNIEVGELRDETEDDIDASEPPNRREEQ